MTALGNVRGARVFAAPNVRVRVRVRPCLLSSTTRTQGSPRTVSVIAASSISSIAPSMVKIQGRKMDVTPAMKEFISEKISKSLSNYAEILREVDVTCSVAGNHGNKSSAAHHKRAQKAEVTVYTHRHGVVRVEDTEDDLYAAVDLVCDKMKRKMVRLKEKAVQKNTWPGRGGTKGGASIADQALQSTLDSLDDGASSVSVEDILSDGRGDIVREKVLVIEGGMSPEEAVEGLEAVGHDFFVFLDAGDGRLKVMYRRASHGYGLIVPSVAGKN